MANIPSTEEVKSIQDKNAQDIADKTVAQNLAGKAFNLPADGHGSGVIPEDVWKGLPGKTEGEA